MLTSQISESEAEDVLEHQVVYIEEVNYSGITIVSNGVKYELAVEWKSEGFN